MPNAKQEDLNRLDKALSKVEKVADGAARPASTTDFELMFPQILAVDPGRARAVVPWGFLPCRSARPILRSKG